MKINVQENTVLQNAVTKILALIFFVFGTEAGLVQKIGTLIPWSTKVKYDFLYHTFSCKSTLLYTLSSKSANDYEYMQRGKISSVGLSSLYMH